MFCSKYERKIESLQNEIEQKEEELGELKQELQKLQEEKFRLQKECKKEDTFKVDVVEDMFGYTINTIDEIADNADSNSEKLMGIVTINKEVKQEI